MTADHDDSCAGVDLTNALQRLHAVHAGHLHVEKDEVRPPFLIFGDPVDCIRDRTDLVALVLEELSESRANPLLVVDDEDSSAHPVVLYTVIFPLAMRTSEMYGGIVIGRPLLEMPSRLPVLMRDTMRGMRADGRSSRPILTC